jgi:3-methyladenine DNA glycosylase AlkD
MSGKRIASSAASQPLIRAIRSELRARADPAKAGPMQAYMKSEMPYLGIPAAPLRTACKEVYSKHALDSLDAWRETVLTLWRKAKYREERYAAIELTGQRPYKSFQVMSVLPMYEEMIVTGAWWDYVDWIASHRLGVLLHDHPAPMKKRMRAWARSGDLWKRRSAILCQLGFKGATDLELLYECIERAMDEREFFLRKAIGWALRQYAKTDAEEVRRYVRANEKRLSPLSVREALKNIG